MHYSTKSCQSKIWAGVAAENRYVWSENWRIFGVRMWPKNMINDTREFWYRHTLVASYEMLLTPWWFVLLEEVIVIQLDKQFYLLWNPKIFRPAHKTRTLDPILSQINPVHVLAPCAFTVNSNSIFHIKTRDVKLFPSIIYYISAVNTQQIQRPDVLVQLGYIWRHVSAFNRPSSGQQVIVLLSYIQTVYPVGSHGLH